MTSKPFSSHFTYKALGYYTLSGLWLDAYRHYSVMASGCAGGCDQYLKAIRSIANPGKFDAVIVVPQELQSQR